MNRLDLLVHYINQAPTVNNIFKDTKKSSNLRTFLSTGSRQHTTIGSNTHCKTTQKYVV